MMADDEQRRRLDQLEQDIAANRAHYLRATWAGHQGEAEWYETEVDRLLGQWDDVRCGRNIPT
jgi:hypothetical protein